MVKFFNTNIGHLKKYRLFLLLSLPVFFSTGCEDCTFTSRNSTLIKVRFYKLGASRLTKFDIDSVRTPSGTVYRKRTVAGIDTLSLPINPTDQNNAYYVFFRKVNPNDLVQRKDTLRVAYNRIFSVISPNCGYDQKVDNLTVTLQGTTVGTEVFKNSLTISDTLNIRISF
ncbi:MAG: hypothetical protein EAZ08_03710 [Cytophagales bacterium]|nr:MAG: hypothetical protein EAZ08_03710 [Cytophagales bacterium]